MTDSIHHYLTQLIEGRDLSDDQMTDVMTNIMTGKLTPAQIAGFMVRKSD